MFYLFISDALRIEALTDKPFRWSGLFSCIFCSSKETTSFIYILQKGENKFTHLLSIVTNGHSLVRISEIPEVIWRHVLKKIVPILVGDVHVHFLRLHCMYIYLCFVRLHLIMWPHFPEIINKLLNKSFTQYELEYK